MCLKMKPNQKKQRNRGKEDGSRLLGPGSILVFIVRQYEDSGSLQDYAE